MHRVVNSNSVKQKNVHVSQRAKEAQTPEPQKTVLAIDGLNKVSMPYPVTKFHAMSPTFSVFPEPLNRQATFGSLLNGHDVSSPSSFFFSSLATSPSDKAESPPVRCEHALSCFGTCAEKISPTFVCSVCMGIYCSEICKVKNTCSHNTCPRCSFHCKGCLKHCCVKCLVRCNECISTMCPRCVRCCKVHSRITCLLCFKRVHTPKSCE